MEISELKAVIREETGKGPARRLRSRGFVPAIFYGAGSKTLPMSISASDLRNLMKKKEENILIKLVIEDQGKKLEKLSVIKELQTEPLNRRFFHADFYEIRMDHAIEWDIPLHFKGTAVGVKNGGELLHQKREIKVSCLPAEVPEFFEIDLNKLDIGHSIKVGILPSPKGSPLSILPMRLSSQSLPPEWKQPPWWKKLKEKPPRHLKSSSRKWQNSFIASLYHNGERIQRNYSGWLRLGEGFR